MQAWFALFGVSTTIIGGTVYLLGKPDDVIGGLDAPSDQYANVNVVNAYLMRTRDRLMEYTRTYTEPSSKTLLPDPLPPQYQRPYTLVLEVNDVLMHKSYERGYGWKFQKRPGVDAFFVKLFDHFEIVTFTSDNAMVGHPLITSLDPNGITTYHLFRDSTKYDKGTHIKDLTNINRPLNKVIIIDTDPKSVATHPDNSIILPKWTGDIYDKTLFELIPLLQAIASDGVDDVRPVLNYYKSQGGNIIEVFNAHQAQWLEEEMRRREEQKRIFEQRNKIGGGIIPFSLGSSLFQRKQQTSGAPQTESTTDSNQQKTGPTDTNRQETGVQKSQDAEGWGIGKWLGWK